MISKFFVTRYVHAMSGGLLSALLFTIIIFTLPVIETSEAFAKAFSGVTFIFAIIAGFFIAKMNDRFSSVGKSTADDDSWWLNVYRNASTLDPEIKRKMTDLIDRYFTIAYDYNLGKYYKETAPILNEAFEYIGSIDKSKYDSFTINTLDNITDSLSESEVRRNDSSTGEKEKMTKGMWLVLLLLGATVILGIVLLRDGSLLLDIIAISVATGVMIIILLIRDLNNFKIGGRMLAEESGQEIFDAIGRLRYYHHSYLDSGLIKIPPHIKEYRVGLHKIGEEQVIEIRENPNYKKA